MYQLGFYIIIMGGLDRPFTTKAVASFTVQKK
jgi:hypothetical protein